MRPLFTLVMLALAMPRVASAQPGPMVEEGAGSEVTCEEDLVPYEGRCISRLVRGKGRTFIGLGGALLQTGGVLASVSGSLIMVHWGTGLALSIAAGLFGLASVPLFIIGGIYRWRWKKLEKEIDHSAFLLELGRF